MVFKIWKSNFAKHLNLNTCLWHNNGSFLIFLYILISLSYIDARRYRSYRRIMHADTNEVSYEKSDRISPHFVEPFLNKTVMEGRNAILSCTVKNLGDYKVAWIKVESQTILTVGEDLVTRDSRLKVTQSNRQNWYLHVSKVTFEDRGSYMCQVNTKPMRYRNIFLKVLVPPKMIEVETSNGITIKEFESISLRCSASGHPKPTITWQREDDQDIIVESLANQKLLSNKGRKWMEGEFLNISRVTKKHMGAYLCIATNQVPPSVSKRIMLEVTFPPRIKVPHQLIGSPIGSDVRITCLVEGYPLPMTSWQTLDTLIVSDDRYQSVTMLHQQYTTIMTLTIKNLRQEDFRAYKCCATNVYDSKEGLIRVYEIKTISSDGKGERSNQNQKLYYRDKYAYGNQYRQFKSHKDQNGLSAFSAKVIEFNSTHGHEIEQFRNMANSNRSPPKSISEINFSLIIFTITFILMLRNED